METAVVLLSGVSLISAGGNDDAASVSSAAACADARQRVEVRVGEVDATNAVHGRWNAVPTAVQKRLPGAEPRLRSAFRLDPAHEADPLDGFAVRGIPGLLCNEPAFRYLLEIERRRSQSTQQAFLLTLIDRDETQAVAPGSALGPERLFEIVCKSVRETDFVGWYRQGAVVGATLTQDGRQGTTHASRIVRDRIVKALHHGLPSELVSSVRLRLYEVLGDDELRVE